MTNHIILSSTFRSLDKVFQPSAEPSSAQLCRKSDPFGVKGYHIRTTGGSSFLLVSLIAVGNPAEIWRNTALDGFEIAALGASAVSRFSRIKLPDLINPIVEWWAINGFSNLPPFVVFQVVDEMVQTTPALLVPAVNYLRERTGCHFRLLDMCRTESDSSIGFHHPTVHDPRNGHDEGDNVFDAADEHFEVWAHPKRPEPVFQAVKKEAADRFQAEFDALNSAKQTKGTATSVFDSVKRGADKAAAACAAAPVDRLAAAERRLQEADMAVQLANERLDAAVTRYCEKHCPSYNTCTIQALLRRRREHRTVVYTQVDCGGRMHSSNASEWLKKVRCQPQVHTSLTKVDELAAPAQSSPSSEGTAGASAASSSSASLSNPSLSASSVEEQPLLWTCFYPSKEEGANEAGTA